MGFIQPFLRETYKVGLIKSLPFRYFILCFDFIKFPHEVDKLKSILYKNHYPGNLIDKCIKYFLGKIQPPTTVASTVPKKDLVIALPYLDKLSLQKRSTRVNRIMKHKLSYCNIWFIFQTKSKISIFLHLKTETLFLRSDIIYKFQCGGCNAAYYGISHFKVRMFESFGISVLTEKRAQGNDDSGIKEKIF